MSDQLPDPDRREIRSIFVESGHKTLNALLLVSGGTTIAYLAFLGAIFQDLTVVKGVGDPAIRGFVLSLQAFVASVATCVSAYGTTYLAHASYHLRWKKTGLGFMFATILLGVSCIISFVIGSSQAINALRLALAYVTSAST